MNAERNIIDRPEDPNLRQLCKSGCRGYDTKSAGLRRRCFCCKIACQPKRVSALECTAPSHIALLLGESVAGLGLEIGVSLHAGPLCRAWRLERRVVDDDFGPDVRA